ncbi:MAG: LDCC motif putative metal-binding protein [Spirochaetaceae bacterium]
MKILRLNIKRKWLNYLTRLEKVNKKLYGSGRLECCDLNKKREI